MTSKEALECVVVDLTPKAKEHDKEEIERLERDLEVLEIIKKWSFIQDNYKEGYGPYTQFLCNIHTIGMKEDFEKVKEWLGNE